MAERTKPGWLNRVAGDIELRTAVTGWSLTTGRLGRLQAQLKPRDYALARQLYHNTADDYKLGGAFAKPVVNTTVAFMGVPRLGARTKRPRRFSRTSSAPTCRACSRFTLARSARATPT